MKIHRVTMTGFGPYRDTETVDFDSFDDDGIFLITGRTGAGKTSILDAITFALFGSVPRYEGSAGEKVRSDYLQPTDVCEVQLEFSAGDERYRVTRRPAHRRPKRRGEGTTLEPATFELAALEGSAWVVSEARLGNAETRIEEIVRLTAKQFLQVILLAQGQFQEFLVASSDKRRELLRMLFDTRRFADYSDALDVRARSLADRLAVSSTAVSSYSSSLAGETGHDLPNSVDPLTGAGIGEWADDVVRRHEEALDEAVADRLVTATARAAAQEVFDAARTIRDRQDRRAQVLRRQADLELARTDVEESRLRLAEARRADLVWHRLEAARTARRAHHDAGQRHKIANESFRQLLPEESTEAAALEPAVQQWSELLGTLRESAEREKAVAALHDAVVASSTALQTFDEQAAEQNAARVTLRTNRETLKQSLPPIEQRAATIVAAEQSLTALRTRLVAAVAAARTSTAAEVAEQRRLATGRDVTQASTQRDDMRTRQRAGFAGVLALSLAPGDPCLVCGSPTHPSPASLAADHVDDADVEQAEADFEEAVRISHQADSDLKELTNRLANEQLAAGDEGVDVLEVMVATAELAVRDAAEAVDELGIAHRALEQLGAEIDELTDLIDSAQQRRATLVGTEAAAITSRDEAVRDLTTARGDHDSVADRLAVVTSHVRAGRALLESAAALNDASEHAQTTEQLLASALIEHDFDDAAAVESAQLVPSEQSELETRINQHDGETRSVATSLTSDDLRDLPDQPVDLEPSQAALTAADTADTAAIAAESAARQKLASVNRLATEIRESLSAAAGLRADHATVHRLASTVRGRTPNTMNMPLETFALAAELEEIVTAANTRLRSMTGGRFEFLHSDALAGRGAQSGLALDVLDAYTGDTRPPQSLSGGEKFQASLALALGLAEVLTNRAGGLRLDTLFIDEGFGSLDADTLETTMATLDNLREGGRTIGLISHVEAMKESIPAQLFVDQTDGGWSTIRTSAGS